MRLILLICSIIWLWQPDAKHSRVEAFSYLRPLARDEKAQALRPPDELRRVITFLIQQLNSPIIDEQIEAAKAIGDIPEFTAPIKRGEYLRLLRKSARDLAWCLMERGPSAEIKNEGLTIACIESLGRLYAIEQLSIVCDKVLLSVFRNPSTSYSVKKEVIIAIGKTKRPGTYLSLHAANLVLSTMGNAPNEAQEMAQEIQSLGIKALGNLAAGMELVLALNIFSALEAIVIESSFSFISGRTNTTIAISKCPVSLEIREKAISELAAIFKKTVKSFCEVISPESPEALEVYEGWYAQQMIEEDFASLKRIFDWAYKTYTELLDTSLTLPSIEKKRLFISTLKGLNEIMEEWFYVLEKIQQADQQVAGKAAKDKIKRDCIRKLEGLLSSEQIKRGEAPEIQEIQAEILKMIGNYGTPKSVTSVELLFFVFSGNPNVAKAASVAILKINDPEAVRRLREVYPYLSQTVPGALEEYNTAILMSQI